MKIRLIEEHELNKVKSIYDNVVKEMNLRGLYNWNESYPNTEIIFKDISNKHLYGIEASGEIVVVATINDYAYDVYNDIAWQVDGPFLSFHRIVSFTISQGKRIWKKNDRFCRRNGKGKKCNSIRISAYHKNENAVNLYKNLGYVHVGEMMSMRDIVEPFLCLEKSIM
ncbi:GNAT family N-acetyltransferase [Clostridium perfringens]|nr:GNAT family N-acetyltransferase [Clostridium perfringens]